MPSAHAGPETQEHPLLGAVLRGTYRIRRVLDRGGLGVVFEAEHLRLHRRLAVKVLARHHLGDPHALARFHREAEVFSQLEHPNVVQVFEFDTTESGEPYLVMEYLTGKSLATVLAEEQQLDVKRVARLTYQAAAGLAAAHRAAIVHRDLKPASIFLVDVPDEGTLVKLLDFGISRRLGRDPRLTGEHDLLATPHYIAPEQALGRTFDARSDQYSLAVIAYEAIAGHTPFLGNLAEVLEGVIANEPVPLARFAPEAPRSLGLVLRRAMAKDPDARYGSVLEFANALLTSAGCSSPPPGDDTSTAAVRSIRHGYAPAPTSRAYKPTAREIADTEPPPPRSLSLRPASLGSLLDQARESFGLGDVDLAAKYIESALALVDRVGDHDNPLLTRASIAIDSILRQRLGSRGGRLRVRLSPKDVTLLPEQAFLLSRLDGIASVEEILDLSPLSRRATLRHLVSLVRQGVLALE